jgi:hypothetical protein
MELSGFVVDHPAAHRDGMPQHFIGDAKLLEGVNASRREREIDRASANDISFTRIGPALVEVDFISTPPEVRRQQSTGEAAADESEFLRHALECLTANYSDITDVMMKSARTTVTKDTT